MKQASKVRVFPTPDELATAAAEFIIEVALQAVAERGRFVIALSGGHTPEHLYELLSTPALAARMPWKQTFTFWGDERCVALDSKDNNAHMAISSLLQKVAIPASNIYRMPVDMEPAAAANAYEQSLKQFFGSDKPVFDLILLGLGENGHTASLFPGTDVLSEQQRWVKEVYVEEQKSYRITLTLPVINSASNIMFLVEGKGKAEMIRNVLTEDGAKNQYPAELITPKAGMLYWFLDAAAATLIDNAS